MLIFVFFTMI